ncbi:MAG: adenylate/guanylate cyclase domain-containing protein [Rubricoccaceae bacterium]|nr:adenylate/guanylate cyclase domain-containing protein [Rubricoccaceae bacterium]
MIEMEQSAPSATEVAEEIQRLRRAMAELTLLNELAVDVGRARDLENIVRTLVRRSLKVVRAGQGVVTLMERGAESEGTTLVRTSSSAGRDLSLRPDAALLAWMSGNQRPLLLADPRAHPIFGEFEWDESVESVLCVPLVAHARLLGVLTLFNKRDGGAFTEDDARLLTIIGMQSAQVIEAAQAQEERDRIRNVFGRHTSPAVVEELLGHEADPPSRRLDVCVMFLDLRGFTLFSEGAEPEEVVDYLNTLFSFMIEAVAERGGIVHQLLGDGFMAVFGAPISHEDDCLRAVEASLAIVRCVEEESEAGRIPPTRVGIGLHAGEVVAGTVGSHHHKEYKVTGDAVNVAARVEQMNKAHDSQLLISEAVWRRLPEGRFEADDLGLVPIRGRTRTLHLFRLA